LNCPDEEAGLFSYLTLYYCDLRKAQSFAFVILSIWLALLFTSIGIAASDFFCPNLSTIASILGMSQSMAGVTFLAFGNGSPDVFSTFAAMSSHSGSLAIGELIGAAGFITAVVAGSMALVREFKVGKKTFVRDVGFFIVAASFSMVFLADGHLHLWECCVMVGFYIFYVVVVVLWHWYLSRRRIWREREAAARGHYLAIANDELEVTEEGGDEEDSTPGERRYRDVEDFVALERGSPLFGPQTGDESDEDGEEGVNLATEMANNMRVTRPKGRRNTITPIRPSLVGALEFRSVLSSLQKSRGSHRSIHLRRYSDDPLSGRYDGSTSEPDYALYSDATSGIIVTPADNSTSPPKAALSTRIRAVSLGDAGLSTSTNTTTFGITGVPNIGVVAATPTFSRTLDAPGPSHVVPQSAAGPVPPSPTISLSPPPSIYGSREPSPGPVLERRNRDTLAPPEEEYLGAYHLRKDFSKELEVAEDAISQGLSMISGSRGTERPRLQIPGPNSRDSSRSPSLSPVYQFPAYTDSPLPMSALSSKAPSLLLPEAILTPESGYISRELSDDRKPITWWPYSYLPSPDVVASALFPTLYDWQDKNWRDKIIGLISAPTIFIFAVTLPVVDSGPEDDEEIESSQDLAAFPESRTRMRVGTGPILAPESPSLEPESEWNHSNSVTDNHTRHLPSPRPRALSGHGAALVAVSAENNYLHSHPLPIPSKQTSNGHVSFSREPQPSQIDQDWNRWLVIVQIFTAPLFVFLIVWANSEANTHRLIQYILYSLLGSLVALSILLATTTPSKPPKYRFLLCFLGFVVSIAWISTIANEVVGVLKALGVILGISDAILGLTIFAVGNSLGDLVADITVANLGYPVMALSACFGGPMLNILLGIGISGIYMTVHEANHRHIKHPGKQIKYKPYQIEVSGTLMISAITLLVTLVGLLIAVPLNNWVMSRRIGWGLITLWCVSTIVNLTVEISGAWGTS
jgi:sodium/potassium/calcium exchanger 6